MSIEFFLTQTRSGEADITVITPDGRPLTANSTHPAFSTIVQTVTLGTDEEKENVADLFDGEKAMARKFERLSERVSVAGGVLYLDGDEMDDALTQQIVRFLNEGVDDWQPLVRFFEKVQSNPEPHSREQLYNWLKSQDLTITEEGNLVGYKSLNPAGEDYIGQSSRSGPGIIDGEVINGYHKLQIGSVVEMPRSEVRHDPNVTCSSGLHVAAWGYASTFLGGGIVAEIEVNPRDVVSVPNDYNGEKVRVCRYTVVGKLDAPYTTALRGFDPARDGFDVDTAFDEEEPEDDFVTEEQGASEYAKAEARYYDAENAHDEAWGALEAAVEDGADAEEIAKLAKKRDETKAEYNEADKALAAL